MEIQYLHYFMYYMPETKDAAPKDGVARHLCRGKVYSVVTVGWPAPVQPTMLSG